MQHTVREFAVIEGTRYAVSECESLYRMSSIYILLTPQKGLAARVDSGVVFGIYFTGGKYLCCLPFGGPTERVAQTRYVIPQRDQAIANGKRYTIVTRVSAPCLDEVSITVLRTECTGNEFLSDLDGGSVIQESPQRTKGEPTNQNAIGGIRVA